MKGLYLVARIADQVVAIASDRPGNAVELKEITPVPRAPRAVLGLAALRSWVVTVIDTPRAIGLARSSMASDQAVMATVEGHDYALLVDALHDAVALRPEMLDGGGDLPAAWRRVVRAAAMRAGERILVLDPAALLDVIVQPG